MKDLIPLNRTSFVEIPFAINCRLNKEEPFTMKNIITKMFYIELWNDPHNQDHPDKSFLMSNN